MIRMAWSRKHVVEVSMRKVLVAAAVALGVKLAVDALPDAAVAFDSGTYRALSFGFPLETVVSSGGLDDIIKEATAYFDGYKKE